MANAIQLANGPLPQAANTTLTSTIASSGASSPTVASAANLPAKGPFLIVVDNERIEVNSISGTTLTILSGGRAQEGTSAASHASSAGVYQVLSAATATRLIDDRTGTVLAPDPTGVAATDKTNLDALASTANRVIQLRAGTYVVNPLATPAAGVVFRGWPNRQTTIKLAVQSNWEMINLEVDCRLEGLILDQDRASQAFASVSYEGMVMLASRVKITDCRFQNIRTSAIEGRGVEQIDIPEITALTSSTAGGSLSTGVQHWYRVTATNATGETDASAEATVTTGAGSTNSNTIRWRQISGATGYKVYHATGATKWQELLLTTIGSGSTLVYVHTTGSGATTAPPAVNGSGTRLEAVEVANCDFTDCSQFAIYGQFNCHDWNVHHNQAWRIQGNLFYLNGGSTSNFGISADNTIADNWVDYSEMTVASGYIIGIEVWNRSRRAHIRGNHVIGPKEGGAGIGCIPISLGGDNDFSTVSGNIIQKSNPNGQDDLIIYGIENAASSHTSIVNNTIFGAQIGISLGGADYNAGGPDNCTITGNVIRQCYDYGIQVTEGGGHVISSNTFTDAGRRYIFINGFQKQTLACAITGNVGMISSNNRSADLSGTMHFISVLNAGRHTITGNVCGPMQPIATPALPTVTPQGTGGGTTYSYRITAVSEYGETVGSAVGTTTGGNATLSGSNFNRISWTAIPSSVGYRVYRTAGAGTQGYIGYMSGFTLEFDDIGIVANTNLTAPATGTSAGTSTVGLIGCYITGSFVVESCIVTGNRFDGSAPVGSAQPDYAIIFDGLVDYTQVVNNFAQNYDVGFLQQLGTPASSPNYVQFNAAPGVPLPHVATPKFSDIIRRADEVQRLGGGVYLCDDFTGGLLTTGNIGDLGWQFLNGSAPTAQAAEVSHSGIIRMDSSATNGTRQYFWCGGGTTGSTGQVLPADWFHFVAMFRMNTVDANTLFRIGLGNLATADPPANGIYVEKLAADTSWFGVTRSSSSQTRTSALSTVTVSQWVKICVRRKDTSTIGLSVSTSFSPDNGSEATLTATIPTAALVPFAMVGNSTAASKTADIDYIEVNVNSMVR